MLQSVSTLSHTSAARYQDKRSALISGADIERVMMLLGQCHGAVMDAERESFIGYGERGPLYSEAKFSAFLRDYLSL